MDEIKNTLGRLKPFIGNKADRIWMRYTTAGIEEKSQWQQMVNLLAQKYKIDLIEEAITLPPPGNEIGRGELFIGNTNYLSQPPHVFGVNPGELTRHLGIFGSTGTGKTTLSKNLLRDLIRREIPFIVFDWEKNYRDLLQAHKEIKIFTVGADTAPFYFNYFKMPDGITFKEYVKSIVEVFNRAYVGGAGSDSVLLKVFDSIYRQNDLPTTKDALQTLTDDMKGNLRGREMLWKQSSLRMLEFLCYGGTGDMFNATQFYPIEKLLDGHIIFELGALSSSNDKRFFIEMFTLWYWLYKELQGIEDEKLKHVLVFEEFHNIVDNSKNDDLIQKIFRQIRKYGTALVIIDQTPALIPTAIFENLYTKITFSLNHKRNVTAIADAMYMEYQDRKYIGMLKTGQAICRLMGRYPKPFLIDIPFVDSNANISDETIREHMQEFFKLYSPEKPGKAESQMLQAATKLFTLSPLERIFLEDLTTNPFDGVDKRGKRLGFTPRESVQIQNRLIENKIVRPVMLDRRKLFELTEQGESLLLQAGSNLGKAKNQGIEHRYHIEQVTRVFQKNGWTVYPEKAGIDVIAEKETRSCAVEVETGTNNHAQIQKNIEKLLCYEAHYRFIIATNEDTFVKMQTLLSQTNPSPSIQLVRAREFSRNLPD
jgi:hypothetical protein